MAADRTDFLLRMYDQMFNDINTHILVVWQSVAVMVGAFALLGLVEKAIISIDVATALIVLLCAWMLAHVYDASYWYNRNLAIITNIERQFLKRDDLRDVHYYFGEARSKKAMLTHLRIQYWLGVLIGAAIAFFHFVTRVVPGFGQPWDHFQIQRALPYLVGIVSICFLILLRRDRMAAYQNFLENSPGIEVDTAGIVYGVGHPTEDQRVAAAERSGEQKELDRGL